MHPGLYGEHIAVVPYGDDVFLEVFFRVLVGGDGLEDLPSPVFVCPYLSSYPEKGWRRRVFYLAPVVKDALELLFELVLDGYIFYPG